jgi:hypothetical protein
MDGMKKTALLAFPFMMLLMAAGDPQGFTVWKASDLKVRGTEVTGGERHRVSAGDIVHIPANTPHQMLVDAGHHVTYFVVKVESR